MVIEPMESEEMAFERMWERHSDKLAEILLKNIPDGVCDKNYLAGIVKGARIAHVRELTSTLDSMLNYFRETYGLAKRPADSNIAPEDEARYAKIEQIRKAITESYKSNPGLSSQ